MTGLFDKHLSEAELALLAGGDLGFAKRLWAAAHVRKCGICRERDQAYTAARAAVEHAAGELPAGLDWGSLAREMTGNIRVGLEAGQAIEPFLRTARRPVLRWNLASAFAIVTLAALGGLWVNLPQAQVDHLRAALTTMVQGKRTRLAPLAAVGEPVLSASPAGLALEENGSSLRLLAPQSAESITTSVSLQGSVGARYVDADSGQVTVNKVYYAQ